MLWLKGGFLVYCKSWQNDVEYKYSKLLVPDCDGGDFMDALRLGSVIGIIYGCVEKHYIVSIICAVVIIVLTLLIKISNNATHSKYGHIWNAHWEEVRKNKKPTYEYMNEVVTTWEKINGPIKCRS